MHLIIGGKYMGKLAYAKSLYGADAPVYDLALREPEPEQMSGARVIVNLQEGVKSILKHGGRAVDFFEAVLPSVQDKVLIGDEVGSGVVPADPSERLWRDETGFLYQFLAAKAETVDRVWAGIPCRLKGKI